MTVLDRIKAEREDARKKRDTVVANLLGTLVGAVTTREKSFNPARPLTEAEVIAEAKKLLDGVMQTEKLVSDDPNRAQQREQLHRERDILSSFLPAQMSEADIEAFATDKKAQGLNMGAIMQALKAEHPGQYDGKLASSVVKRVLG